MSKATIKDWDNVFTSPEPSAARPVPKGIKVPIKPRVGPIRVMISVTSRDLSVNPSSFSINFRANASLVLSVKFSVSAILFKRVFCDCGREELLIVDFKESIESELDMSKIKLETSSTETFVLEVYS